MIGIELKAGMEVIFKNTTTGKVIELMDDIYIEINNSTVINFNKSFDDDYRYKGTYLRVENEIDDGYDIEEIRELHISYPDAEIVSKLGHETVVWSRKWINDLSKIPVPYIIKTLIFDYWNIKSSSSLNVAIESMIRILKILINK